MKIKSINKINYKIQNGSKLSRKVKKRILGNKINKSRLTGKLKEIRKLINLVLI